MTELRTGRGYFQSISSIHRNNINVIYFCNLNLLNHELTYKKNLKADFSRQKVLLLH
jgi:hypothetical protein